MAPSLQTIRRAALKKRKAKEIRAPTGRKAVAKAPKRTDADDVATGRADARKAADARESAAGEADAGQPEAGDEVQSRVGASSRSPPMSISNPIILPDPSPEQAARALSSQANTAEAASVPSAAMPTSPTVQSSREVPIRTSPPAGETEPRAGSSQATPSPRGKREIDPSFQSILSNYGRWAEETLGEASVSELQGYIRCQRRSTFFRETAVAHLWALNSYVAMKDMQVLSDVAVDKAIEEMDYLRTRAERAEMALEDARATSARVLQGEIDANRLRAEKAEEALEIAQRKAANELDNAQVAEEKLEAAELKIQELNSQLHSVTIEIETAKERANTAEEASRRSDGKVAELKVALTDASHKTAKAEERAAEAEKRTAEAEKRASEAEERASNVKEQVAKAVEDFRKSEAFDQELAETTAFAYDGGFNDCKERIRKLYGLEGIEDLEPEEPPEDGAPAPAEP